MESVAEMKKHALLTFANCIPEQFHVAILESSKITIFFQNRQTYFWQILESFLTWFL